MTTFLTDSTDINRFNLSAKLNPKQRSELGQFMTPATVARLMAGQFNNLSGHINLLDPGAGFGSLTAAFVERLLTNSNQVESCFITAYEVEASFIPSLQECLNHCCQALKNRGIKADYCLQNESFIGSITENNLPLFNTYTQNFTHAI
ncbi:restriction endonuclease, partial [Dolichospermum sp. LEGE 00246]|nr:restriction endonuclease [Dolichospermum sp. LEGE 00246]